MRAISWCTARCKNAVVAATHFQGFPDGCWSQDGPQLPLRTRMPPGASLLEVILLILQPLASCNKTAPMPGTQHAMPATPT